MEISSPKKITIRPAKPDEFEQTGKLLVEVYSALDDFPGPKDNPRYYQLLANPGTMAANPGSEILVAVSEENDILGAVVFIGDLNFYGSNHPFEFDEKACGFRLLAVSSKTRGQGVGQQLIDSCIQKAKDGGHSEIVIHSTDAMKPAIKMYERAGFVPSPRLDFYGPNLTVYGFRLKL